MGAEKLSNRNSPDYIFIVLTATQNESPHTEKRIQKRLERLLIGV